jgi:two-component system sensor histidine kinase CpxA
MRAGEPPAYWIGARIPMADRDVRPPMPMTLIMVSESLAASGLVIDFTPWITVAAIGVAASVLFWFPLVRGITRSLRQMTGAAERIAGGSFDTRVRTTRRDELGRLGAALNDMAARLHEFFTGQKRFLGDIAHELCSPLARMEIALSILEQRADEKQRSYVADVREEVQQMSALVNELLSFSKAGIQARNIPLEPVPLAVLAGRVVAREANGSDGRLRIEIDETLAALADPGLLSRALGNVVRNSIRYAGQHGSIVIAARPDGERVSMRISDEGPGVPDAVLHRLFDPFFRPEAARTRESGGFGLGLAIVKSCVEACGGGVAVRNRQPHGLEVEFTLQRAPASVPAASTA